MNITEARRRGFTLVELLIVIMIIGILAGMILLATGSATDGAEATKIINDLRNLKSAAVLYYGDTMKWPTNSEVGSLDRYTDRPITTGNRYKSVKIGTEYTDTTTNTTRVNLGIELNTDTNGSTGIRKKLESKANDAGLLGESDNMKPYTSAQTEVWINMR